MTCPMTQIYTLGLWHTYKPPRAPGLSRHGPLKYHEFLCEFHREAADIHEHRNCIVDLLICIILEYHIKNDTLLKKLARALKSLAGHLSICPLSPAWRASGNWCVPTGLEVRKKCYMHTPSTYSKRLPRKEYDSPSPEIIVNSSCTMSYLGGGQGGNRPGRHPGGAKFVTKK